MNWKTAAALGLITDVSRVALLGDNADIDTATVPEDVWGGSVLGILNAIDHKLVQIPSSAVATEIVSDNANDTAAGTGLRTLIVNYLDSTYTNKTVTITMNGTTPVAMPENIMAVNIMIRSTTGTFGGTNLGNISLRAVGGLGATYGFIEVGTGFSRTTLYTVPLGYSLIIYSMLFTVERVAADRWATFSFPTMNSTGAVAKALEISISSTSPYRHETGELPVVIIPAKNSVWITCETVSANNTAVSAGYSGLICKTSRLLSID